MADAPILPAEDSKGKLKGEALVKFLLQCKAAGKTYRDRFKPSWDECEAQIRCVLPESYKLKEDWQTKIFIPLQSKKSETAASYLNKMVFGKTVPFDITGVEGMDSEDAQNLTTLIGVMMQSGGFGEENKFVVQEAIDIGTGWMKKTLGTHNKQVFTWRSAYQVLIDPKCGHKLDKARFVIDQYEKDIADIIQEAKSPKSLYSKVAIGDFIKAAVEEAKALRGKGATGAEELKEAFMTVRSFDGPDASDVEIPSKYATMALDEYWVDVPQPDGTYAKQVISLLNDKYILRDDANVLGYIPFQWCRIKPRKYDSYGRGYIENTRGLQELSNSCINLGFDSLKISSMDIIVIDDSKVKDPTTIKYKPLAVWKMKDINAVKIQRQPVSAISDILRGLTLIDQIDQDASGVTRAAQGAPNLSGAGTESETLGEYELKLQAIDQRFLDVGRFLESDYLIPLVKKMFKDIQNKKIVTQDMVNRILGMKEIDDGIVVDGAFKKTGKKKVPKLDLEKIRAIDEMEVDFKAVGVTQFSDRLETISKFKEILMAVSENEQLAQMTRLDVLWKKVLQAAEIPDYDEFLKTKEEIKAEMDAMMQMNMGGGMMGPDGQPMPGGPQQPQGAMQ